MEGQRHRKTASCRLCETISPQQAATSIGHPRPDDGYINIPVSLHARHISSSRRVSRSQQVSAHPAVMIVCPPPSPPPSKPPRAEVTHLTPEIHTAVDSDPRATMGGHMQWRRRTQKRDAAVVGYQNTGSACGVNVAVSCKRPVSSSKEHQQKSPVSTRPALQEHRLGQPTVNSARAALLTDRWGEGGGRWGEQGDRWCERGHRWCERCDRWGERRDRWGEGEREIRRAAISRALRSVAPDYSGLVSLRSTD